MRFGRSYAARRLAALALVAFYCTACPPASPEPKGILGAVEATEPVSVCVGARSHECRSAEEIARRMEAPLRIVQAASASGGVQGASVITLRASDGVIFDAKWRAHENAWRHNDPAAELAAYAMQALVLEPRDYVIPPTAAHCFEQREYRTLHHDVDPHPGTKCVLGYLSYWLNGAMGLREARRAGLVPRPADNAQSGDPSLYDSERFARDGVYRRNLAHLNVVAHLMAHGDAHAGQFVMYRTPPHIFLVDNSVAFGLAHRTAMKVRQDLAKMVVPAIPSDTAERLLALGPTDIHRLRSVATLRRSHRRLVPASPTAPFGDEDKRLRDDGRRVQVGLTRSEIDGIDKRLAALQQRLRDGSLPTFDP